MAAPQRRWAAELLHFWFHRLGPKDWFSVDPAVDDELRRRFARELTMLARRPALEFLDDPPTALASVLLFDQLPRNLYRGSARAYSFDPLALAICLAALRLDWHRALSPREQQFLALPLMHSEHIADQRAGLVIFARLGERYGWSFARAHHRMIARFGRFPHRNGVLGRISSPAEKAAIAAGHAW